MALVNPRCFLSSARCGIGDERRRVGSQRGARCRRGAGPAFRRFVHRSRRNCRFGAAPAKIAIWKYPKPSAGLVSKIPPLSPVRSPAAGANASPSRRRWRRSPISCCSMTYQPSRCRRHVWAGKADRIRAVRIRFCYARSAIPRERIHPASRNHRAYPLGIFAAPGSYRRFSKTRRIPARPAERGMQALANLVEREIEWLCPRREGPNLKNRRRASTTPSNCRASLRTSASATAPVWPRRFHRGPARLTKGSSRGRRRQIHGRPPSVPRPQIRPRTWRQSGYSRANAREVDSCAYSLARSSPTTASVRRAKDCASHGSNRTANSMILDQSFAPRSGVRTATP